MACTRFPKPAGVIEELIVARHLEAMFESLVHRRAVTILESENCQSISLQNMLGASNLFRLCDLTVSIETVRQL